MPVVRLFCTNKRMAWGSGTTGGGGTVVVVTGLTAIESFVVSCRSTESITWGVSISGGNVTVASYFADNLFPNRAFSWIAIGT